MELRPGRPTDSVPRLTSIARIHSLASWRAEDASLNLVGPVFWKELIEASRRKRYLLLRCIVPCLFLFVVFIIGVEEGSRRTWSNETVLQQQNRAGRAF